MQNASISLLSGKIGYGINQDTIATNNLENVSTTCSSSITTYTYNSTRLLWTYGVALAVSVIFVTYCVGLILRNGAGPKFSVSSLIGMALNSDMICAEKKLRRRTKIRLLSTDYGQRRFIPVSIVPSTLDEAPSDKFRACPFCNLRSTGSRFLMAAQWKMVFFIIGAVCAMAINHAFYHYVNGKVPSSSLQISDPSGWLLNQTIVSDIGIALAYVGQTFIAVVIVTACHQFFWLTVRNRGLAILAIDFVMKAQDNPFSFSTLSALRVSIIVPLLTFLAASTPLVSIFAPGSIKVTTDFNRLESCTVLAPRDMSSLAVNAPSSGEGGANNTPLQTVLASGSYIPPIDVCGLSFSAQRSRCSYDLQFTGPGFNCENVTTSNTYSAFVSPQLWSSAVLFQATSIPLTANDLPIKVFVQTWDVKRSEYQATTCTSVARSYSVSVQVSEGNPPILDVTGSRIVSSIQANISQKITFTIIYSLDQVYLLSGTTSSNIPQVLPTGAGGIGSIEADGNITWNANLAQALEEFSQNATLSVLSGQISTFNVDIPNVLENITTTCTYTFTAYEYTPQRLFLTYGIGIFVTILCAILGSVAIRRNGVDESMDFSRLLRAILNERMYEARENLNGETVIKADETPEGALAPVVDYSL
ncbi:hypothetical protein SCHPADRAFT_201465 [Schizopora paradoxa]|uniref:Transmembrane protein n=1 Tax=Schizopora paradoxa TaxID=27342 RepID=A0A0H2RX44_9AGAM|nr:hypothetical protein SCHPADRAFT_201465 [Schizopora paradoxa]